jgi:hypothetical protein
MKIAVRFILGLLLLVTGPAWAGEGSRSTSASHTRNTASRPTMAVDIAQHRMVVSTLVRRIRAPREGIRRIPAVATAMESTNLADAP